MTALTVTALVQTQFVPGWAIIVPLLLLVVVLAVFFVDAVLEEMDQEDQREVDGWLDEEDGWLDEEDSDDD